MSISEVRAKIEELHKLVSGLRHFISDYALCLESSRTCRRLLERAEEVIMCLLRGETKNLHIILTADRAFELRNRSRCLTEEYYITEPRYVDLICVRDTPLGKLLLYSPHDAVLNPTDHVLREIVESKVKPELREAALQILRRWLTIEQDKEDLK